MTWPDWLRKLLSRRPAPKPKGTVIPMPVTIITPIPTSYPGQSSVVAVSGTSAAVAVGSGTATVDGGVTDGTLSKPYQSDSFWYQQVPGDASFSAADMTIPGSIWKENEFLVQVAAGDPTVTWKIPGSWSDRDSGTSVNGRSPIRIPDAFVVPDANGGTPNNSSTFFYEDGSTIEAQPSCRPTAAGTYWAYDKGSDNWKTGTGQHGSHGGSGISAAGGSLRAWEVSDSGPIAHRLKINLWAKRWLYWAGSVDNSYVFPASNVDGYANSTLYGGVNPDVMMGSHLAIPPGTSKPGGLSSLGSRVFDCLRDYGCHIVDDTYWEASALCCESTADIPGQGYYSSGGTLATGFWHEFAQMFPLLSAVL